MPKVTDQPLIMSGDAPQTHLHQALHNSIQNMYLCVKTTLTSYKSHVSVDQII